MQISEDKRYEIAVVLSTRFPAWDDRSHLARQAGLTDAQVAGDPLGSWRLLVKHAIEADRLVRLLEACAAADPRDARLQALAEGARTGSFAVVQSDLPVKIAAVGAVVLGLAFVVVLGMWAFGGGEAPATVVVPPAPTAVVPPPAPAPAPAPEHAAAKAREPAPAEPATPAPPAEAVAPAEPAPAPQPEIVVVQVPAAPPEPEKAHVISAGACKGATPKDGVIGYAYAGADAPVVQDGAWKPGRQLNVRRDYPRGDNGFNAKAQIVCAISEASTVVVAHDPIAVIGGAYWVPVADVR